MNTIIINGTVTKRPPELKTSRSQNTPYWVFYVKDQRAGIKDLYWRCIDFRTTAFYKTLDIYNTINVVGRVDRILPYQHNGKVYVNNDIYVLHVDYSTTTIPCAPDYDPKDIDDLLKEHDHQCPCVEV